MAGIYADIPGTRFALDQDGTILKWRNYTTSSAWTDITSALSDLDKVSTSSFQDIAVNGPNFIQLAFAFPEARSINGIYIHWGGASDNRVAHGNFTWESSSDTTDGTDGTWSSFGVSFSNFSAHDQITDTPKPYYRTDIAMVSLSNVKGIRVRFNDPGFGATTRLAIFHMYGSRPTSSVDRLAFWNPSSDAAIGAAALDFGDVAQGSSVTKQFRIKNLSGTLTANSITLQVSDLLPEYGGSGIQVSTDNSTYQSSVNIGNLSSGTISSTLYVRRTVGGAETTTQRHARLLVNAASWT